MAYVQRHGGQLNASTRAATLMKWVNIGVGQAAIFVLLAAVIDKKHCGPILAGGVLAAVLMYVQYIHAKQAGLRSDEPGTET